MGNFFSKRWVTIVSILFICFMVYGFSADVSYAQCYQCEDGTWQASCTTCYGGGSPPCTNSYSLRSGYSCGEPCSEVVSDRVGCDYPDMSFCYNGTGSFGVPADNLYNSCGQQLVYKCVWTKNTFSATTDPSTWQTCKIAYAGRPYCKKSNWVFADGAWRTWFGAQPGECVAASVGPYGK